MIRPVHGSSSGYATRRSDWAADETLLPWLPGHTPLHLLVGWFIQAGSRSPRQQIGFLVPICSRRRREARWIQEEQGSEVTPLVHRKQLFILKYSHPSSSLTYWDLLGRTDRGCIRGRKWLWKVWSASIFSPCGCRPSAVFLLQFGSVFIISHWFSVGFRSGLWLGHSNPSKPSKIVLIVLHQASCPSVNTFAQNVF